MTIRYLIFSSCGVSSARQLSHAQGRGSCSGIIGIVLKKYPFLNYLPRNPTLLRPYSDVFLFHIFAQDSSTCKKEQNKKF